MKSSLTGRTWEIWRSVKVGLSQKINDYFKAILTGSGKAPGWYECFSPRPRRSDTEQAALQRAALDCEISPLKWSKLQFHECLCLLSYGHVFFFFFCCGGFHSLLPPTMWIMSCTDSSQWSDPPVNQWNLTTMSRSGLSCWDWPAGLHTPLPPTHTLTWCLQVEDNKK